MPRIPRDKSFDGTPALIRDPYGFIAKRCGRYGSDLFETRLMLRKTTCMTGPEAAELFYDQCRFVRRGAMPFRIQKSLLGRGGVQGLDGEAHRRRKRMLMSLMTPERIGRLSATTAGMWHTYARKWESVDEVVLYDEACELLTRAVCAWAGAPLAEAEVGRRTRELTALFDYAGSVGPKHWRSRLARRSAERWTGDLVERILAGDVPPPEHSAAHVIAWHRDLRGEPLSPRVGDERDVDRDSHRRPEHVQQLHGTNHDARTWDAPQEFRPERFRRWDGSPFDFVPQGGGDHHANHRCAGEWITIDLMKVAADFLSRRIGYDVPEQDLRIDPSRLPALPRSRYVLRNVGTNE